MSDLGLFISQNEIENIRKHGELVFPEECCGVLIAKQGSTKVIEARAMRNTNNGSKNTRYNIDPFDLIALEDELDEVGKIMVGIYHSHPNHPAMPSETDLKFAWPNLSYVVLSVKDGKSDKLTSWKLNSDKSEKQFVEEKIIIE